MSVSESVAIPGGEVARKWRDLRDGSAGSRDPPGIACILRCTCLWGSAAAPGRRTSRNTAGRSPCRSPRTARSSPWCCEPTVATGDDARQKSDTPINATPPPCLRLPPRMFRSDLGILGSSAVPTSAKRRRTTSPSLVSYEQEARQSRGIFSRYLEDRGRLLERSRQLHLARLSRTRSSRGTLSRFRSRRCRRSAARSRLIAIQRDFLVRSTCDTKVVERFVILFLLCIFVTNIWKRIELKRRFFLFFPLSSQ